MVPGIWRGAILTTGFLLFVWSASAGGGAADARSPTPLTVASTAPAAAMAFDVNDCKTCHEKQLTTFEHTKHMKVPGNCANCHGDVTAHLKAETEKGEKGPIISLKKMPAGEVNKTCLTCHDKARQANWTGGIHDKKGLACINCHSIHEPKSVVAQLKTARDSETCFSCHPQMRAKSMRTSHHPVREGKMDCASCHDPHDSTKPKMVSAESVNEKCLSCHTEKRGPFLWEHAPVRENCLNCHDPHGSNHDKMLVAKLPYLCQRCHLNTRHPGTLYDLRNTIAGANFTNRAVEHACKNCHQNIHGSNAPSGPYLGR
jgi:DmsE family decaheme c-type cytochrome